MFDFGFSEMIIAVVFVETVSAASALADSTALCASFTADWASPATELTLVSISPAVFSTVDLTRKSFLNAITRGRRLMISLPRLNDCVVNSVCAKPIWGAPQADAAHLLLVLKIFVPVFIVE